MEKQLKFIGQDEFGRNAYVSMDGTRYAIVDGVMHKCDRHGEPEYPTGIEYRIVSRFERKTEKMVWVKADEDG